MERKGLSSSRERNRKGKMMERSEGCGQMRQKDLIVLGMWPLGSYEEQRGEEEGILRQFWDNYKRVRAGGEEEEQEGDEGIEEEN